MSTVELDLFHVYPTDDVPAHRTDGVEGVACLCQPVVRAVRNEDGYLAGWQIVHRVWSTDREAKRRHP